MYSGFFFHSISSLDDLSPIGGLHIDMNGSFGVVFGHTDAGADLVCRRGW